MRDINPVVVGEKYRVNFFPGMICFDGCITVDDGLPKGPSVLDLHNGHVMTVMKYDPPQYDSDCTGNATGLCECGKEISLSSQFLKSELAIEVQKWRLESDACQKDAEGLLELLKSEVEKRDVEIRNLKAKLKELEAGSRSQQ